MPSPVRTRFSTAVLRDHAGYLLAAAIGIWAALDAFPLRDLLGRLPPGIPPGADGLQHIAGQLYFLAEPWHWPLLTVHRLDPPHGVNIGLTDSIPLEAVLLKLLHPMVPRVQEGIGPWLGAAWALQPIAAVYALRGTGERGLAAGVAVAVMASAMPTFLVRAGHEALDGHFLLLLALGLYLRATRPEAGRGPIAMLSLLVTLSLFVHPYLMAMVAAIAVAAPTTLALRLRRASVRSTWRPAASTGLCVLVGLGATAALAKLFGYLGGGVPGDYGLYAMNLAAPVWPALSRLAPQVDIQAINATGAQLFEGYQYLGAGLLLLLLAAVIRARGRAWLGSCVRRHAGLLLAIVVLTAYAVTTHVYLFHHSLLRLRFVPPGGHSFRASGRLFWPAAYVLLITGVRGASIAWPRARGMLLVAAAALQLFDSSGLRTHVREERFFAGQPEDATEAALDDILAHVRSVTLVPRIECDGTDMPAAMRVIYLAARHDLPVNTMYAARVEAANRCDPARDAAASAHLAPGALGVAYGPGRATETALWTRSGLVCDDLASLTLCSVGGAALAALAPTPPGTKLPPGETITAVRRQLFADGLASGWGAVEPWGAWAVTPSPALRLHVGPTAGAVRVTLALQAPPGVTSREIRVRAGGQTGRVVATATLGQHIQALGFVLAPGEARAEDGRVIALAIDAGPTVTIPDIPRRFGIGLVSVRVAPAPGP